MFIIAIKKTKKSIYNLITSFYLNLFFIIFTWIKYIHGFVFIYSYKTYTFLHFHLNYNKSLMGVHKYHNYKTKWNLMLKKYSKKDTILDCSIPQTVRSEWERIKNAF